MAHRSAAAPLRTLLPRPPPPPPVEKSHFASLLNACSNHQPQLMQIHALLLTTGLSRKNSLLTTLLSSLILLRRMPDARRLFDSMHKPRTFLWNLLIRGYVNDDLCSEALAVYARMHHTSIRPDNFTFPFVFKACAVVGAIWGGPSVHAIVLKSGFTLDVIVLTELTLMYARFGDLGAADYLFEGITERDLVAWNALIAAYAQDGHAIKALALFHRMDVEGVVPDSVTLASALSACAYLGLLGNGMKIEKRIVEEGLQRNVFVDNALLDMYAKCGNLDMMERVFSEMPRRNVVSWSSMIGGYAINGECRKALDFFSQMRAEGMQPNHVTYLSVLSACSHAGFVREGRMYFSQMTQSTSKSPPRIEHYACMVDLLGRAGHLMEAYNFISRMPIKPDSGVWGSLLGACNIHQNVELGQKVADQLFNLAPQAASYYVLMSNIYAAAGRWMDVEKVRQSMRNQGVKKVAAYSSLEANGEVHVFHGADRSHPLCARIYEVLDKLIKQLKSVGYVAKTNVVLHDVEMEEKEVLLGTHSEKIAIAFGILSLRPDLEMCLEHISMDVESKVRKSLDCASDALGFSMDVGREVCNGRTAFTFTSKSSGSRAW
ncbi:hypothetical protein ACLOJK_026155 [Asimina triloba]